MKSQPRQKPYKCPICARWHMTTCATSAQSKLAQKKKDAAVAAEKGSQHPEYVKELIKQTRESEWAEVGSIAQAMHAKITKFDVKQDLGYKKFSDWVDSTGLMEKKKTPKTRYYRLKGRKAS